MLVEALDLWSLATEGTQELIGMKTATVDVEVDVAAVEIRVQVSQTSISGCMVSMAFQMDQGNYVCILFVTEKGTSFLRPFGSKRAKLERLRFPVVLLRSKSCYFIGISP